MKSVLTACFFLCATILVSTATTVDTTLVTLDSTLDSTLTAVDTIAAIDTVALEDLETQLPTDASDDLYSTLTGTWKYDGPSVALKGRNVLASVGKPIAKNKIKKKLDKALKKLKINKKSTTLTLNADHTYLFTVMGKSLRGNYTLDPTGERLTLRWHSIPITGHLERDGNKKMQILFDTQKLLRALKLLTIFGSNSTLKALSFLTDYYEDINVGLSLKK